MKNYNPILNIVIFASGDFPFPTIKELITNKNFNVKGIVTSYYQNKIYENIADISRYNDIPLYIIGKGEKVDSENIKRWLIEKQADVFCVISFKYIPEDILKIPKITSFNVHASLLPLLKGAAPINWAIRYGLKETGLTSFVLDKKIDSGKIIDQVNIKIKKDDNFGSLYTILSKLCVDFTIKTLFKLNDKNWTKYLLEQKICDVKDNKFYHAPKLTSNNTQLEISQDEHVNVDIQYIDRQVKSLYPFDGPNALLQAINTDFPNKIVKEYKIKLCKTCLLKYDRLMYHKENFNEHNILTDGKTYMYIISNDANSKYVLSIEEIQILGKKRLKIKEFLAGFQIARRDNIQLNIK